MRTLLFFLSLFAPLVLLAENALVEIGDELDQTLEILGQPLGTIELRDKTVLLYPQGEVTLKKEKVTAIDLMSEDKFNADQVKMEKEREEWVVQQARLTERRTEEAYQIKGAKLKSRAFAALPAEDRVDHWRSYQMHYPEIDVSEQIGRALEGYEVQLAEQCLQERIAQLEARVALAEKDAASARLETKKALDATEARSRNAHYGLRYYIDPRVNRNDYNRAPTVTIYSNRSSGSASSVTTHHGHQIRSKSTFHFSKKELEQPRTKVRFATPK